MNDRFELTILQSGSPATAMAMARCGDDLALAVLDCSQLSTLLAFKQRLQDCTRSGGSSNRPTAGELQQFGNDLFAMVMVGDVGQLYRALDTTVAINIQFISDHPSLQSLPWEYMQDPRLPAGHSNVRRVSRVVPTMGVKVPEPRKVGQRAKVLLAYADPVDGAQVDWALIKSTIEAQFKDGGSVHEEGKAKLHFDVDVVEGASETALLDALNANTYDVFHFIGHGRVTAQGEGELALLDRASGRSDYLSAGSLWRLLSGRSIRLVVLSACSSGAGDPGQPFALVASSLVKAGVPAVVAKQFAITNSAAASFAGSFYARLVRNGPVDHAVSDGRDKLERSTMVGTGQAVIEWGIPILFRHISCKELFTK